MANMMSDTCWQLLCRATLETSSLNPPHVSGHVYQLIELLKPLQQQQQKEQETSN